MKWFPDWSHEVAAVIASGPSANKTDVAKLKGFAKVIVVNRSVELAPWADVWYATDFMFWAQYGRRPFGGIKVGVERKVPHDMDIRKVRVPSPHTEADKRPWMLMEPRGVIGTGGNSGFQALNLCAQFGAKRILLVGFDMTLEHGSHWHGDHIDGFRNPEAELMAKWRRTLDAQANTLSEYGIDVINTSPLSALRNFRKATIEEVMGCLVS